jgi:hypothetical protein
LSSSGSLSFVSALSRSSRVFLTSWGLLSRDYLPRITLMMYRLRRHSE